MMVNQILTPPDGVSSEVDVPAASIVRQDIDQIHGRIWRKACEKKKRRFVLTHSAGCGTGRG
jgi:hypothetical protein